MYETHYDDEDFWKGWGSLRGNSTGNYNEPLDDYDTDDMNYLVLEHPEAVAKMLIDMGFTPDLLIDEAKIPPHGYANNYVSRKYM
jgi:hypothetical protein